MQSYLFVRKGRMTSILGSSLLNLAATLVSLMAGFLVSVINARVLGPAGSGTVAYAMWVVVCAAALADRGFPQMVLRYVAALRDQGEPAWRPVVRQAFKSFLPVVLVVFLLLLAYGLYHRTLGRPAPWIWIAASVLFLAYVFSAFSAAAARGRGRFGEVAAITAVGSLLQIPLVFMGAFLVGPGGAFLGMLTRYLPQALSLPKHLGRRSAPEATVLSPEMQSYRRSMWASDAIDIILLTRIEYLVIGYFLADADVGYFAAAVVFAGLVGQMTLQLSPAFLVGLTARAPSEGASGPPSELYRNSLRLTALFMMPLGIGGAAVVGPLVPLVFGNDFAPAANAAVLFMLASVPAGIAVVPWASLAAGARARTLMHVTLLSAALIFTLLIIVVPVAGIWGAAVVRVLSETLTLAFLLRAASSDGGPSAPWNALLRTLVAASLCGVAAFAATVVVPGIIGIVLAIGTGALVYLVAIRLLGLIATDEATRLFQLVETRLPGALRPLAQRLVELIAASPARTG
ncbi:oligosaccharide flippase family protein [Shinella kummerowiae]|uniref:Oligosaccharide flippase family protein n=2 Tax=Shinella kummerowiae TaxID=417745 RepID=A0A6N8SC87_9HYPH|nr:oligosaccharide flippase family protein [Shinella kummerowiae]